MLNSICRIRERERGTHTHIYIIYAQERQKERRERREERGGRREERGTHSHALTNELTDIHPNVYQHNPKCEKANAKNKRPSN
jgi:DNA-binding protein H-NS